VNELILSVSLLAAILLVCGLVGLALCALEWLLTQRPEDLPEPDPRARRTVFDEWA
jgi:hypothetical protein